jgi:hypothetical protein
MMMMVEVVMVTAVVAVDGIPVPVLKCSNRTTSMEARSPSQTPGIARFVGR